MKSENRDKEICPGCGALNNPGTEYCVLCGTELSSADDQEFTEQEVLSESIQDTTDIEEKAPAGVFCNNCGWSNPDGAKFCNMCGSKLQEIKIRSQATFPPHELQAAGARRVNGKQIAIIVTAGVLIVITLYLVTLVSKPSRVNVSAAAVPQQTDESVVDEHMNIPLPPQLAEQADALEAEIEKMSGQDKLERQDDLVSLYYNAGRLDRAAIAQEQIASEVDTPESWTRAGNMFFDWMESIKGDHKSQVALLAISAYRHVLEKQPDNLNVKTDMAWAYQYDPQNAVQAITLTNEVLEKDPEHLQANFNKGVFLIQINRLGEAEQQFEKVKSLSKAGSVEYERANASLEAIKQMNRSTS